MTLGTCGLTCDDWLQSADHQSSSENKSPAPQLSERLGARLMERLARYGSMEYSLTWKRRVTPAGRLYYQQRASARRISGRDCGGVQSGWLTPQAQVGPHGYRPAGPNGQLDLDRQVLVAGWPTPRLPEGGMTSADHSDLPGVAVLTGWPPARAEDSESTGAHRGSPDTLTSAAQVSGWPTPKTPTGGGESAERKQELGRTESGGGDLQAAATLAGWATPRAGKTTGEEEATWRARNEDGKVATMPLTLQVQMAGWATPNAGLSTRSGYQDQEYTKARKEAGKQVDLMDEAQTLTTGAQPGSPAQTGPRGVLNPQFPLWLMGYPEAWATCAPGHQSWATVQKVLSETPDASARAYCEGPGTP